MTDIPSFSIPWRLPQQTRSWERFHRILDAAAELFVEVGYESVTADEIAARANTSVGGLYRFFPDKSVVFLALLDRYFQQLQAIAADLHQEANLDIPLDLYIGGLVDEFDRFVNNNPGFRVTFTRSRLMPDAATLNAIFYANLACQANRYFARRNPDLDPSQRELIAIVSVEVACALDLLALSSNTLFQQQVLIETKKLLIAYLEPYLT